MNYNRKECLILIKEDSVAHKTVEKYHNFSSKIVFYIHKNRSVRIAYSRVNAMQLFSYMI